MARPEAKFNITAIDNSLQTINRINKNINSMLKPVRNVQRGLKELSGASGLANLGRSVRGVGLELTKLGGIATGGLLGGLFIVKNTIIDVAAKFEKYEAVLTSIEGTSTKAKESMDWVSEFAAKTPFELDGVMDAFVKLRTFGLKPLDGTLQALADQTAKLGGDQQKLEGVILAIGQAWTKSKLQGEEALQLIERGVPVWDLLAETMGKSVVEIQDLSRKGELGRDAISKLIKAMGDSSLGASAKQMKTWNGLMANLSDQWTRFIKLIGDGGIFQLLKGELKSILDTVDKMSKDGSLKKWATDISKNLKIVFSDGKAFLSTIARMGKTLSEFAGGPANLAKVAMIGIAAILTGPLLSAIVTLGVALSASPIGLVILGITAAVTAAVAVWSKFGKTLESLGQIAEFAVLDKLKQVSGFVSSIGNSIGSFFATGKSRTDPVRNRGGRSSPLLGPAISAPNQQQRVDVGRGVLEIKIDSSGNPRVKSITPPPALDINVDAGIAFAN